MKYQSVQYIILRTDGFAIHFEETQDTPEKAWASFDKWKSRYEGQGYYSTIKDCSKIRIPLEELREACEPKKINF